MLRRAVRVRSERAEIVLAQLLALVPHGVEEVDGGADAVEYVLYGSQAELPSRAALAAAAGDALLGVTTSEIPDDWAERWRSFHKPLVLGTRLCVRPPWEAPRATALDIVIDPGRAFGTGSHATTRLCLELLLDLEPPTHEPPAVPLDSGPLTGTRDSHRCVDLGCGSGVLSIAAAKLGWGPVLALDRDQAAVDATLENAHANGVADQIDVRRFDLISESFPPASLVLANLLAPLLFAWSSRLAGTAHGRIVASGLLSTEAERVSGSFNAHGYRERARLTRDEWSALLFEAPSS